MVSGCANELAYKEAITIQQLQNVFFGAEKQEFQNSMYRFGRKNLCDLLFANVPTIRQNSVPRNCNSCSLDIKQQILGDTFSFSSRGNVEKH